MNNRPKAKAIVFIDETNLHYGFRRHNWDMEFEKFFNWLRQKYEVIDIYFCKGELPKFAFFVKLNNWIKAGQKYLQYIVCLKGEFNRLRELGVTVISKIVDLMPNREIVKGKTIVKRKPKCNFDVEITTVALDRINDYEELVLCSGDGDFAYLLNYLKNKGKKVTVISFSDMLSKRLKKATKYIITMGSLRPEILRKRKEQKQGDVEIENPA